MKRLYTVLMILLPIFVGSLAIGELIAYLCNNGTTMNPIVSAGLALVGMMAGIRNILKLIK